MWRVYPKHHALQHTLEDQVQTAGCPALVWNYADESFIGDAVDLAESLHGLALHRTLVSKYRI
eukprot:9488408-Pyramimonas_sp.AAC.1